MRKILYALLFFALSTSLLASDPFAGTWKLNSEKTRYKTGAPPKEVTVVMEEQGDQLHVTVTGMHDDGSPLSVKYSVPVKGGMGMVETGDFNSVRLKVIGKNTREFQYLKDGKEIRMRRMVVSEDGKTMQTTMTGTNALGKQVSGTDFFDRQ